jgi:hypothetical protein
MKEKKESVILITIYSISMVFTGILGNRLAEFINLSAINVVLILIGFLALIIFVKIKQQFKGKFFKFNTKDILVKLINFFYSRLINIFLLAMLIGLIFSFLCFKYLSNNHFLLIAFVDENMFSVFPSLDYISFETGKLKRYKCWIWDYELLAYVLLFSITYLFSLSTQILSQIVAFCLGISMGVTTSLLLFASHENQLTFTLLFWVIIMIFCLAIISSTKFKKIINSVISSNKIV